MRNPETSQPYVPSKDTIEKYTDYFRDEATTISMRHGIPQLLDLGSSDRPLFDNSLAIMLLGLPAYESSVLLKNGLISAFFFLLSREQREQREHRISRNKEEANKSMLGFIKRTTGALYSSREEDRIRAENIDKAAVDLVERVPQINLESDDPRLKVLVEQWAAKWRKRLSTSS